MCSRMTIEEIDSRLRGYVLFTNPVNEEFISPIKELKEKAIEAKDELLANALWCYETVFEIQQLFNRAFEYLKKAAISSNELVDESDSQKSKEYEKAWNELDQCDITISSLEKCFCIPNRSLKDYSIEKILIQIQLLQTLFPYRFFGSREMVIKEEKCSICGQVVSIRHPCGHIPGNLYCGQMCYREVTDVDLIGVSIVEKPFDKYSIIKAKGQQFDFKLLDSVVPLLKPNTTWSYEVEKRLLPQYEKAKRNMVCPCGSGIKYKKCLRLYPDRHYEDHYIVRI